MTDKRETLEPQYQPLAAKRKDPFNKYVVDIISARHVSMRNEIGNVTGAIQLAFFRGYQAGYIDGAEGSKPEFKAGLEEYIKSSAESKS